MKIIKGVSCAFTALIALPICFCVIVLLGTIIIIWAIVADNFDSGYKGGKWPWELR